jgi:ADP-ribose pyrophosphatase
MSKPSSDQAWCVTETEHLRVMRRRGWEYVQRRQVGGVVVVAALTLERRLLLLEQFRIPVDAWVIELPAGLAQDTPDTAEESLEDAARRELIEETGYGAADLRRVFAGPSTAGLSDEVVTFFIATQLTKVGAGGGVGSERIRVREVPWDDVPAWLDDRTREGHLIDARLYTGVYLLEQALRA